MSTRVLKPLVDGFKDSLQLWVGILVALVTVVSSFVSHSPIEISKQHSEHPRKAH